MMASSSKESSLSWHSLWSLGLALGLAAVLLVMWQLGLGPARSDCCAGSAPTVVTQTTPAPLATPAAIPAAASVVETAPPPKVAQAPAAQANAACTKDLLAAPVTFHSGSAVLTGNDKTALDAMVPCLQASKATVVGHSDNVGQPASNLALSLQRAVAGATYLQGKGVAAANLKTQGHGDQQPIADNATVQGRTANRRIDIRLR